MLLLVHNPTSHNLISIVKYNNDFLDKQSIFQAKPETLVLSEAEV